MGISTANQYWGPAHEFPIILGNNAAGFPHVFFGTASPLNLSVLRVSARLIWGRLSQSAYSPETGPLAVRYATGGVFILDSRHVPGLEIGASRFAHLYWSETRFRDLFYSLGWQSRAHFAGKEHDNQLASIFFRWAPPRTGFEVYAEYGRDDFWEDLRDLANEPDHYGGYTVGFEKVWGSGSPCMPSGLSSRISSRPRLPRAAARFRSTSIPRT